MVGGIFVVTGGFVAILLDWAIYTHLSAFLRLGLALDRLVRYRDLTLRGWQRARLLSVAASGAIGGLAFAIGDPELWIFAVGGFLIGHSLIYPPIVKK